MPMTNIAATTIDGQLVYYRPEEVIAIGQSAGMFALNGDAADLNHVPTIERDRFPEQDLISTLPPMYLIEVTDPVAVVDEALSRGLRVQLNHVLFAHGGCCCDPCCSGSPYGAFPFKATPFKATPFKATPFKATPSNRTSAVPTGPAQLPATPNSAQAPNVDVWILDTGIGDGRVQTGLDGRTSGDAVDHPDRKPVDDVVDPVAGHGTFIAGIIEQLTPGCRTRVVGVIDGEGAVDEWHAADEIYHLLGDAAGIDLTRVILNLSFGGALSVSGWAIGQAIASAQEPGVVVVASAGNDGACTPIFPAAFPGVTSVGALDHDGDPAPFTNRGAWVDACTYGVDLVSTYFDFDRADPDPGFDMAKIDPKFPGGWAIWSGTSFATPVVVAAIAARMGRTNKPSAVDARAELLDNGTEMPCLGVRIDHADVDTILAT